MRRLPAPVLPGAPKPPNAPPSPSDSPKLGDDKLPTGRPRFTRLKIFWKLIETFRLYLFSLAAPAPPCGPTPTAAVRAPLPPPPCAPTPPAAVRAPLPPPAGAGPPGPPAAAAAVCPVGFAAAALPRLMTPNANARLTRRLTTNAPGA